MNTFIDKAAGTRSLAAALAMILFPGAVIAREPLASENVECIGRFKLSLPGPVEFVLTTRDALLDYNEQDYIAFSDASMPRGAAFALSRKIDISQQTTLADFAKLRAEAIEMTKKDKKDLVSKGSSAIAGLIKPYELGDPAAFAWSSAAGVEVFFSKAGHIYRFNAHSGGAQKDEGERAKEFLANMRARKLFELPSESGICSPYSFLNTNKALEYTAGVAMQLSAHPEVEILFRDSQALAPGNPMKMDARAGIEFFMKTQQADTFSQTDYHWQSSPFAMAGIPGKAAFVNVRREDKQNDIVFIGYVPGAAGQSQPSRDLMLYVSRHSSRAKGVPISEAAFRELAAGIAKSVAPMQ